MRLLLIEDDRMIAESLMRGLGDEGYAMDWVGDGDAAVGALTAQPGYAAALLDWGLPGRDGLSVLRLLRSQDHAIPVLMITARSTLADRVAGLDGGADDYLVKPFELPELKARVRCLLRRKTGVMPARLSHGDLSIEPATRSVCKAGTAVSLTPREFALVEALMQRPGQILSRLQIEERLYACDDSVDSNAVEFIIHGVRRKLGAAAIDNVRALGWRIGGA